ncbi:MULTISPECIES: EutN/CcmL family microcompartment protein [Halanaerobium]|jgi:ethanolamine utilization protein EutN|uniref:Ethanolamine utilization protein EutN n=1 Tax=Halanaerobium kushneri TaxID=56779 RepID=A0A1N6QTJ0_9FIRM|nr:MULTISPECIES: EutN/CcmL family microcompartment protein [Halanaerobium]RCW61063.1 ethanolamine utilization protein EutN [Halanaerobium sp. ST460_2HS_T2]SIQ19913.1 ethanolamine utilization protein EutN [Halanaerobium kushneri]
MQIMEVVGNLIATRKDEKLVGSKFLVLKDYQAKDDSQLTVAVDLLGAGVGEKVLIVEGSSARKALNRDDVAVDAVVVGIVDNIDIRE